MVKSFFILIGLILLTNCKSNIKKEVSSENKKYPTTINKAESDTINLSNKSKTLDLINVFFTSNIISINDSIFINKKYLAPFYGSNKDKIAFNKYSTSLEINDSNIKVEIAKNFKATHLTFNQCNLINEELSNKIINDFTYVSENLDLIDGSEKKIWKLYCTKNNFMILGFQKPLHIESIHPSCDYKGIEVPLFFRDVFIAEKTDSVENFALLSYNFKNILNKAKFNCE